MNRIESIHLYAQKYNLPVKTVEKITAFVYGISLEKLFLIQSLSDEKVTVLEDALKKISQGYPLDYLLENTVFFGLNFYVNDQVLIPRDDTELLVEKTIAFIQAVSENVYYFDIGTGSGCIPVAVFSHVSEKIEKSFLYEVSQWALDVARKNVEILTPSDKFHFFCDDFHNLLDVFSNLKLDYGKPIVITANLPYIKVHDIYLEKTVLDHEPTVALFGGTWTWFELYDDFFEILLLLQKKFWLQITVFAEIGYDQAHVAQQFLEKKNLNFSFFRDTWYHDRVIQIQI